MLYKLGAINFRFSPASIFRTFLTAPKMFRGTNESIEQRMALCRRFDKALYARGANVEDLSELVSLALRIVNEFNTAGRLSEAEQQFIDYTVRTISAHDNQATSQAAYNKLSPQVARLAKSKFVQQLFDFISRKTAELGIDLIDIDGTDSTTYGNAVFGQYIPQIRQIGLQVDTAFDKPRPDLTLADVAFHEELHAHADAPPKACLPKAMEEELCEFVPKSLIREFLGMQRRWGIFRPSDRELDEIISGLWVNKIDRTRHECVQEAMGGDPLWGFKLLTALKKFSEQDRLKADEDCSVLNRAIRECWPGTKFKLPFFCDQHNYGIG